MRTFIFAMTAVALVGCGENYTPPGVNDTGSFDPGDTGGGGSDDPNAPKGEVQVDLVYPDGSTADGVEVGFKSVKSGEVATVTAGQYDVSVNPFEGQGTEWFVADDGENAISVVADESTTVTVGLDRFLSSSGSATPIGDQGKDAHTVYDYNCWSYDYAYEDPDVQKVWNGDQDPYDDYNHGWFSVEAGTDGVLSIYHEVGGSQSFVTGNDNGLRVHRNSLMLTGDVDGDYPYRMEESTVKSNGDFRFLLAVPYDIDADPATFVPRKFLEFRCERED